MLRADTMLTLTFQDNEQDLDRAWSCWGKFRKRLSRWSWGHHYVVVHELQKRGAIHFHVALKTDGAWMPYSTLIAEWRKVIGGIGSVKITRNYNCRERQRAAKIQSYLSKYMGKDFSAGEMNRKRYEISRGLPRPECITLYYPIGDDTHIRLSELLRAMSGRPPETSYTPPGLIYLRTF